jgi:uncharacterized membrane protein YphA (DoxX/SURF4 family)
MKTRLAALVLAATTLTAIAAPPASASTHGRHHHKPVQSSCGGKVLSLTIALVNKTICIPL